MLKKIIQKQKDPYSSLPNSKVNEDNNRGFFPLYFVHLINHDLRDMGSSSVP